MSEDHHPRTDTILPVVFGGDVGAYNLGLECYEAFGVRSINVAHEPVDLITRSAIFDIIRISPQASDEERLEVLRTIVKENPGRSPILLANNDALIAFFSRHREELDQHFAIPFPSKKIIDLLTSKDSFAEVCAKAGALTPPTVVVDLSTADEEGWEPPILDFRYPMVAKADSSDTYEKYDFPGKKKIWYIDTPEELAGLWESLIAAGYRDKFLVQELIPGDDTYKRTVTLYVDSSGKVTLRAAGQVLLEDPSPTMIGNPAAMISRSMPELWAAAERILEVLDYRGFANFDLKVDPRDGTPYFFELNPRAGRSSYFIVAGGQNPMEIMARDLVLHEDVEPVDASRHALYTLLPIALILRYVKEPRLRNEIKWLVKRNRVLNPLYVPVEKDLKRRMIVRIQGLNHFRKFQRYYRADL